MTTDASQAPRVAPATLPFDIGNEWNISTAMANSAAAFKGFSRFIGHLRQGSELTDRVRETTILRLGAILDADYEWGRHVPRAQALGMSDDEIIAIRTGALDSLPPDEAVAAMLAEAVETRSMTDELWSQAGQLFVPSQLVELTVLSGCYGLVCRFALALNLQLDDDIAGLDVP